MVPEWFQRAKLGIFIHWGIYAVDGIAESWSFYNRRISHADYMRQLDHFTAAKFDPEKWADLFARSGARYAVLTSKHHDGVALWNTREATPSLADTGRDFGCEVGHPEPSKPLSIPQRAPAGTDLIAPFLKALRQQGLRCGLYFSHLDWSHGDYASMPSADGCSDFNPFGYSSVAVPDAWTRFLAFHRAQLKELCTEYGEIDLLWFDGDWERSAEDWNADELRAQLKAWQPSVVLNSRMQGRGDYATPEQGLPITPPEGAWEFCLTINDSWGFQHQDTNYKTPAQVLRTFVECIGMGGNLLLDIGPQEDGTIPQKQVEVLEHLGAWISRHEEAVYTTGRGLPSGHFFGPSTLSGDGLKLYLMVIGNPNGEVSVRGLVSQVVSARMLGNDRPLTFRRLGGADWMTVPGVLWIEAPVDALEPEISVIELTLGEPLKLYRGAGQGIEQN